MFLMMIMIMNELARRHHRVRCYQLKEVPAGKVPKLIMFFCFVLCCCCVTFVDCKLSDGPWGETNPKANPLAIVQPSPNSRFTVLTDRLIRMEQKKQTAATKEDEKDEEKSSSSAVWEDRKTLAVINRNLPVPNFTQNISNGILTIETKYLKLQYTVGQPFHKDTLIVTGSMGPNSSNSYWTWTYGESSVSDEGNLLGTIRTLDTIETISLNCTDTPTSMHCESGLISRTGYAIVDDSKNWALTTDGKDSTEWWDSPNNNDIDLYLFGHGHSYKDALADYIKIGGRIPLLPRYAWGVWFSRWYDYNPTSMKQVVDTYEQLTVPLDVFVLDMNWHTKNDWTGYSWDNHLFTPTEDSIAYLKHKNLAVTMNLHDAHGVNKWEKQFVPMCKHMGCNSSLDKPIPFSIVNKTFLLGLEDIVLKPLEDNNGVDFWWIDWQQGEGKFGGDGNKKNPTIWTAHIRSTNPNRRNQTKKRGMVLARFGGLGSHRYPIHFSGDAYINWRELSFQPYFSMTATNVGACWSHDISAPLDDPELFTRWIQWSVFSGVSRVHDKGTSAGHCAHSKDPKSCTAVEPWNAPPMFALANYEALRQREALIPYIYTASYTAYQTGLWFVRPLYYDYPELEGAYITGSPHPNNSSKYESQLMFGDDLMVIPVVKPANTTTGLAALNIWIPPGTWVGLSGGRVLVGDDDGGTPLRINADINEIPVFARVGSIIPTIPVRSGSTIGLAMKQYDDLIWTVFMSFEGTPTHQTRICYEDDGATADYLHGHSASTRASYTIDHDPASETETVRFTVATSGSYRGIPKYRSTTVRFLNALPPSKVTVANATFPYSRFGGTGTWSYNALEGVVIVEVPPKAIHDSVVVELAAKRPAKGKTIDGIGFKISKALSAKESLDQIRAVPGSQTGQDKFEASLMRAASSGSSLEFLASDSSAFLSKLNSFHSELEQSIDEVKGILDTFAPEEEASEFRSLRSAGNVDPTAAQHVVRALNLLLETQ